MGPRIVTREEFDRACEAVWTEIEYQNYLPRCTGRSEAMNPGAFAALGRVYLRRLEDAWSDNAGDGAALPVLRKLAGIFVRSMVYCGIRSRGV